MEGLLKTLGILAAFGVLTIGFGGLGYFVGMRTVRRYPSAALALHLIGSYFKLNPPPPPTAETFADGEHEAGAGDPPKT